MPPLSLLAEKLASRSPRRRVSSPPSPSERLSSASARGLHPATHEALVAPWLGQPGQGAFYRQIAQADQRHTDEIEPRYGEIDAPVLVCWGEEDTWLPVARCEASRSPTRPRYSPSTIVTSWPAPTRR